MKLSKVVRNGLYTALIVSAISTTMYVKEKIRHIGEKRLLEKEKRITNNVHEYEDCPGCQRWWRGVETGDLCAYDKEQFKKFLNYLAKNPEKLRELEKERELENIVNDYE